MTKMSRLKPSGTPVITKVSASKFKLSQTHPANLFPVIGLPEASNDPSKISG